jgi:transposase-like protein
MRSEPTGAGDGTTRPTKWKELSGEERYRVVELARRGDVPVPELCATFGVSRQTLYRTMRAADRASIEALEPRKRGRKPRPASLARAAELETEKATLAEELSRWRRKYEVAKTILELERQAERGERLPGEGGKKRRRNRTRTSG